MSIATPVNRERTGAESPPQHRLQSGDRLSRAEFERRYESHPATQKAELVEGVAYVASPSSQPHADLC